MAINIYSKHNMNKSKEHMQQDFYRIYPFNFLSIYHGHAYYIINVLRLIFKLNDIKLVIHSVFVKDGNLQAIPLLSIIQK